MSELRSEKQEKECGILKTENLSLKNSISLAKEECSKIHKDYVQEKKKADMYFKRMEELETGLSILSRKNKFEQEKGKLTGTLGVIFRKNEELKKQVGYRVFGVFENLNLEEFKWNLADVL